MVVIRCGWKRTRGALEPLRRMRPAVYSEVRP
jgi:hypothetical protein